MPPHSSAFAAKEIMKSILSFAFIIIFFSALSIGIESSSASEDVPTIKKDEFDPWPWCDKRFPAVSDKVQKVGLENTSKREQVMYVLYLLVGEVWNGGFEQYYSNSSGEHALEAYELLLEVGSKNSARILKKANNLFPGGKPHKDRDIRNAQLEKIPSIEFERLDKEFVENNPEGYVYEYIWRYWTKK
jgi:hypothetical protein